MRNYAWLAIALLCASCTVSPHTGAKGPTNQAPNANTQHPVTNVEGYQGWTAVSAQFDGFVGYPEPASATAVCDFPRLVTFEQSGAYTAGPCHQGAQDTRTGTLTASNLLQLEALTDAVAQAAPQSSQFCDIDTEFGNLTINLVLQDNSLATVFDYEPAHGYTCYRGGVAASFELARGVRVLIDEVYKQAFGT